MNDAILGKSLPQCACPLELVEFLNDAILRSPEDAPPEVLELVEFLNDAILGRLRNHGCRCWSL